MAVRNEKTMEKKRIPVRPHHGMCLAYFIGKGYSEGFSAHMEKMLHILEQDVSIRLVVSLDEICSACPNRQVTVEASGAEKEICEAQEKVYRYDHGANHNCSIYRDRPRCRLCNSSQIQHLIFFDPMVLIHELILHQRNDHIPASKSKGTQI